MEKIFTSQSIPILCRRAIRTASSQQWRFIYASDPYLQGIDKVAENKIAEWMRRRGDDMIGSTKKGEKLSKDRHKDLSRTLGVHHDYIHSKILADNNIKPESLERRLALDAAWEKLREEIRQAYIDSSRDASPSIDKFVVSQDAKDRFGDEMRILDQMVKKLNDSIISDSLRFNGRCPVRHARRFNFEERVREAVGGGDSEDQ